MASPYEDLAAVRVKLQNLMAKMMTLKQSGQGGPARRHLMTEAAVLLIELRQLNRVILKNEEDVKLQTERAKAPVDSTTLKLHNLLYEKNHYLKAIKACSDFKSKYPDIDLVSEEDFFKNAPDEFKSDPELRNDPHKLMLQRLNYELYQRKELVKQREVLETRKRTLQESINSRKTFLATLPEQLKALKTASLPVQQQLGLLHTKKLQQHKRAELLPTPLYILYSQLISYREAFEETMTVDIVGNVKDAMELLRADALRDAGVEQEAEELKEDDTLEDRMDEDDGTNRRKRPKHGDHPSVSTELEANSIHPLAVVVHVYNEQGKNVSNSETNGGKETPLAVLHFEFHRNLHLVYASAEGDDGSLLANLFPNDAGLEFPNTALKFLHNGLSELTSHRGRPFKWAQHLAGLDFLPEIPPALTKELSKELSKEPSSDPAAEVSGGLDEYRRQHRVHNLLEQLRLRCKAVKALKEQLESFRKLKRPSLPRGFENILGSDSAPKCTLRNWTAIKSEPQHVASHQIVPVSEGTNLEASKSLPSSGKSGRLPIIGDESGQEDGELPGPAALQTPLLAPPPLPHSLSETARLRNAVAASTHKTLIPSPSSLSLTGRSSPEPTGITAGVIELPQSLLSKDSVGGLEGPGNMQPIGESHAQDSWRDFGLQQFKATFRSDYPSATADKRTSSRMELEAMVHIYGEYPVRPPSFTLRLLSPPPFAKPPPCPEGVLEIEAQSARMAGQSASLYSNAMRLIEAEVNMCKDELNATQEVYVLTYQVHRLMHLFDAFVDSEGAPRNFMANTSSRSTESVTGQGLVGTRTHRGRQRSLVALNHYDVMKGRIVDLLLEK